MIISCFGDSSFPYKIVDKNASLLVVCSFPPSSILTVAMLLKNRTLRFTLKIRYSFKKECFEGTKRVHPIFCKDFLLNFLHPRDVLRHEKLGSQTCTLAWNLLLTCKLGTLEDKETSCSHCFLFSSWLKDILVSLDGTLEGTSS